MNGGASLLSQKLLMIDAYYKQMVYLIAECMECGTFNRALMFDAVLLADQIVSDRQIEKRLRNPVRNVDEQVKETSHD